MKTVNIHEAKTQLETRRRGAKAGKPVVKVIALRVPTGARVAAPRFHGADFCAE